MSFKTLGFAATKVVNGVTVADYTTEATNNTSVIGKMINAAVELLKRQGVKGTGGVVGTYDKDQLGGACHLLFDGAQHADSGYGVVIARNYFETAKLL